MDLQDSRRGISGCSWMGGRGRDGGGDAKDNILGKIEEFRFDKIMSVVMLVRVRVFKDGENGINI